MYVRATEARETVALERALRLADGRRLGMGEHDGRDRRVVGHRRLAQDVGRRHPALVLADVGEEPDAGDVADRPEPLTGPHRGVDIDLPGARIEPHRLEADVVHPWSPARRDEQPIPPDLASLTEGEDVVVAVAAGCGDLRSEVQLDAVGLEGRAQRLSESPRRVRQETILALDDDHLRAERAEHLGHLHTDGSAAHDEEPLGNLGRPGRLAVAPEADQLLEAGHRRQARGGSGRNDDVGRDEAASTHLDDARPGEPTVAPDDLDPLGLCPCNLVAVVVVVDHEVPPAEGAGGRDRPVRHPLARARGVARCGQGLPRAEQRLGRHARVVVAFSAEQLALDDGHVPARVGQEPGAVGGRRATPEDQDVVGPRLLIERHGAQLIPARRTFPGPATCPFAGRVRRPSARLAFYHGTH